jgi:transcription elongation factor GreA-like protein
MTDDPTCPAPRRGGPVQPGGYLRPGDWVTHPGQPDWGAGQVQSVTGQRVTVTFEHQGKVLINTAMVALEPLAR